MVLRRAVLLLALSTSTLTPAFGQGPGPSIVHVVGHQLMVQKRNLDGSLAPSQPYAIRGVVWSPASKDTNTSPSDPNNAMVRRPEFAKWAATDVPLMAGMHVNTVRLFIDPGFDATLGPSGLQVLDELYARGIMVIMTVDDASFDTSRITGAVSFYKNHPAVLMWMLGNEWNVNKTASAVLSDAQRIEAAAANIKSLDNNHPVSTSYGDIDIDSDGVRLADTQHYVNDVAPSVDVWGLNIYRSSSFGTLFKQWASISTKPMFLSEFGTDAFFSSCARSNPPSGMVDERAQKQWDLTLWNEIVANLSGTDSSKVALGGTVFELSDEWWKVQPPNHPPSGSQETSGFKSVNSHPDDFANEEYFGITDIERNPRQVYYGLRRAFAPGLPSLSLPPSQVDFFSLPATVKTNISAFLVAGRVQSNSRAFLNGTEIIVDSGGTFVSRYPLSSAQTLAVGPNAIELRVLGPDASETTTVRTVDYEPSFSTQGARLLYVDSVAPNLPGTIVIDLDAEVILGLLDQQHVRGISADGSVIYMDSHAVISTSSHVAGNPLPFSSSLATNGVLVSPLGDFLYSGNEIVNRSSNALLASHLPVSILTGNSFNGAPIPGGPAITPDGQFIYCCANSSSITKIDRVSLASNVVSISAERPFVSDLSVSPDGTVLSLASYGNSSGTDFLASFYNTNTLIRLGSATILGDYSGEVVFSAAGQCAVAGSGGNPVLQGGGITVVELSGFQQHACSLIDLATNLTISSGNELYVSSGTRAGVDVIDLQPCEILRRSRTYFLGINQSVAGQGVFANGIGHLVLRDLPALTVEMGGTGGGTVTSAPAGIACGSDCVEGYPQGTVVTLTATPDPDSVFTGWTGDPDCSDGVVTMQSAKTCMATFNLRSLTLTVSRSGNGSGTVTSVPAGIACGGDCTESYLYGTQVTLTATPTAGSVFAGWTGDADCSDGVVTMQSATTCIATFNLQVVTLTISRSGNGSGTVTSAPSGISCGNDCTEGYSYGTQVTLTATPSTGSVFAGWTGDADCSDGVVTMQSATTCVATFNLQVVTLTVSRSGNGSGTVTSAPSGINCGNDCTEGYSYGTQVTLAATPSTGSVFAGWTGDADCSDGVVTLQSATTCVATFNLQVLTLTVSRSGNGSGTVTSAPSGINCGNDCTEGYSYGTQVTLTAAPAAGSLFTGWTGDPDCADGVVTMQSAKTCVAGFATQVQTLTVSRSGNGSGTVTSSPSGITCGADCTESYAYGAQVTLTATPGAGSVFMGWSGDPDCSDGVVVLNSGKNCVAEFRLSFIFGDGFESGNTSAWQTPP
jgi:hypothetical protein